MTDREFIKTLPRMVFVATPATRQWRMEGRVAAVAWRLQRMGMVRCQIDVATALKGGHMVRISLTALGRQTFGERISAERGR